MVKTQSKPRIAGGVPIIHNNAPLGIYQDCGSPGERRKRDGSCPFSSTLTTSFSTTVTSTVSCSHVTDAHNTCTAIANGPGWCMCGDSPNSYAVQTSADVLCGWTALPPMTSFNCPTATTTPTSTPPSPTTNPAPWTPPASPPVGIIGGCRICLWKKVCRLLIPVKAMLISDREG